MFERTSFCNVVFYRVSILLFLSSAPKELQSLIEFGKYVFVTSIAPKLHCYRAAEAGWINSSPLPPPPPASCLVTGRRIAAPASSPRRQQGQGSACDCHMMSHSHSHCHSDRGWQERRLRAATTSVALGWKTPLASLPPSLPGCPSPRRLSPPPSLNPPPSRPAGAPPQFLGDFPWLFSCQLLLLKGPIGSPFLPPYLASRSLSVCPCGPPCPDVGAVWPNLRTRRDACPAPGIVYVWRRACGDAALHKVGLACGALLRDQNLSCAWLWSTWDKRGIICS